MIRLAFAVAALTAQAAQPTIRNDAGGPLAEFGAAAIRAAAKNGRVHLTVSRELKPEAFRIRKAGGGWAIIGRRCARRHVRRARFRRATGAHREGARQRGAAVAPRSAPSSSMFRCPAPATCPRRTWPTTSGSGAWTTGASSSTWRRATGTTPSPSGAPILTAAWCGSPNIRKPRTCPRPSSTATSPSSANFSRWPPTAAWTPTWSPGTSMCRAPSPQRHHVPASGFDSPLVRDYQREAHQGAVRHLSHAHRPGHHRRRAHGRA